MASVPQISGQNADVTTLVDKTQIAKPWPEDVICECSKRINKLSDLHALSLVSKHFLVTIFNNTFPAWSTL